MQRTSGIRGLETLKTATGHSPTPTRMNLKRSRDSLGSINPSPSKRSKSSLAAAPPLVDESKKTLPSSDPFPRIRREDFFTPRRKQTKQRRTIIEDGNEVILIDLEKDVSPAEILVKSEVIKAHVEKKQLSDKQPSLPSHFLPPEPSLSSESKKSYYLRNFHVTMQTVSSTSSHLFSENEKSLFGMFFELPESSQRLLVRLFTRKGPWFKINQINYPEISPLVSSLDSLVNSNYLDFFGPHHALDSRPTHEVLISIFTFGC